MSTEAISVAVFSNIKRPSPSEPDLQTLSTFNSYKMWCKNLLLAVLQNQLICLFQVFGDVLLRNILRYATDYLLVYFSNLYPYFFILSEKTTFIWLMSGKYETILNHWNSVFILNFSYKCTHYLSLFSTFQKALSFHGIEALYVLTDGKPDTSYSLILTEVERLRKKQDIKIHTISFHCADRYVIVCKNNKNFRIISLLSHCWATCSVHWTTAWLSFFKALKRDVVECLIHTIIGPKLKKINLKVLQLWIFWVSLFAYHVINWSVASNYLFRLSASEGETCHFWLQVTLLLFLSKEIC